MKTASSLKNFENEFSIHCTTVGPLRTNTYVVEFGSEKSCILIDPGLEAAPIKKIVESFRLNPKAIFCTHGHFDHIGTSEYFQNQFSIPVYMHKNDSQMMRTSNFLMMAFKIEGRIKFPKVSWLEGSGDMIEVDNQDIEFFLTPGHTPGSCIFALNNSLFCGDTLFSKGVEFSKLPGMSKPDLVESIKFIKEKFNDETLVYSGHGRSTSLGEIWLNNLDLKNFLSSESRLNDG